MYSHETQLFRVNSYSPPSPLTFKKRRLNSGASRHAEAVTSEALSDIADIAIANVHRLAEPAAGSSTTATFIHYSPPVLNAHGISHNLPSSNLQAVPVVLPSPQPPQPIPIPHLHNSLAILEASSHAFRVEQVKHDQDGNQTGNTYSRHVRNYQVWWIQDQAARFEQDPSWVPVPAFPVTATKAALFLAHETTREKRKRGTNDTIAGSNLGKSHVAQVINALEDWRRNHAHEHKEDHDAQRPLREDVRITTFEKSAKRNEPKRIASSQTLKAAGSSADTYTAEELRRCSLWCLTDSRGPRQIYIGIRDRAMLLLASVTAFRGESSRILEWSDLFISNMPLNDVRNGFTIPVLAALADNAKHNQNGRLDEHGALRHRQVELCPVGGLALLFFSYFHVLERPLPNFAPDFSNPQYGEYGRREWYDYHVFSGKDYKSQMSYDNHRERLTVIHKENNIAITKVTHAARSYAAQTARAHGASVSGTKALGGWNENGSFRQCYERTFPADALLGAAMFNGNKPETYLLLRDELRYTEPPPDLLSQIFPWIEQELEALDERVRSDRRAEDFALRHFLQLLLWLRRVLLQDAALLVVMCPEARIFTHAPFNGNVFRTFSAEASLVIERAEERARVAYEQLPEHMVQSLRGITTGVLMEQQQQRDETNAHFEDVSVRITKLEGMIGALIESQTTQRRQKGKPKKTPVVATPLSSMSDKPAIAPDIATATAHVRHLPMAHITQSPPIALPSITINFGGHSLSTSSSTVVTPAVPGLTIPSNNSCSRPPNEAINFPNPIPDSCLMGPVPTSIDPHEARYHDLLSLYGPACFQKHQPWEWNSRVGDYIPTYRYSPITRISEVWQEWSAGINGHISVRELDEKWGSTWRRNDGTLKTEFGRRKKIVNLVNDLADKRRWSHALAIRFLTERYEPRFRARAFCDYLTKNGGMGHNEVIRVSENYP